MPTPDRAKEWSDIELGSREWYTHISISPTLELVWSGASDAVNIPHTVPVEAVAIDRQRAFVGVAQAEDQGSLLIFDVRNPAAPTQRAYLPQPGYGAIRLADGLALIAAGRTLQIVDVSDPDHPAVHGSVETPEWMTGLSVAADRVYVTTQGNGNGGRGALSIFDISDSTHPTLRGTFTTLGPGPSGVQVIDNLAYVVDTPSLVIVDVSNPGAPKRIGSYELGSEVVQSALGPEFKDATLSAERVQVIGPRAYLGTNVGFVILDVSHPAKPALLGSYSKTGGYFTSDIEVIADRAYVTFANWGSTDFGGMDVVDIGDPAHPRLVGGYTTNFYAYDVQVVDHLIYVANGRRGLLIFRLQS